MLNNFPSEDDLESEGLLSSSMKNEREAYYSDPPHKPGQVHLQRARMSTRVMNLSNTIVGAGLMALPKVVEKLGIVTGVLALILVLLCAFKTLGYILKESTRVGSTSFTVVVRERLGPKMALVLDASIIINNIGLLIIYLRIISDVLIGNNEYKGIITDFLKDGILTKAEFSVGMIALLVLLPLCSLERMDSLAAASTSGLSLAIVFCCVTIAMSVIEIVKNGLGDVSWGLNPQYFGGNFLQDMNSLLSVFPVIFTALVCHYNLLHIKDDLPPRYYNKMPMIVKKAGTLCITLYILVACFGYILFKKDVQADVLLNFNCQSLDSVVGPKGCVVVGVMVRSMYAITLLMTFPLIHFALREAVMSLLFSPEKRTWVVRWVSTCINLLTAFAVAMNVPNIWTPLQITGAVAAGIIGFIIPSMLHLNAPRQERTFGSQSIAALFISLGILVGIDTVWMIASGQG